MDGQGTKRRRKITENYNCLSMVHERYGRQTDKRQTDGRATANSERERCQEQFSFELPSDTLARCTSKCLANLCQCDNFVMYPAILEPPVHLSWTDRYAFRPTMDP